MAFAPSVYPVTTSLLLGASFDGCMTAGVQLLQKSSATMCSGSQMRLSSRCWCMFTRRLSMEWSWQISSTRDMKTSNTSQAAYCPTTLSVSGSFLVLCVFKNLFNYKLLGCFFCRAFLWFMAQSTDLLAGLHKKSWRIWLRFSGKVRPGPT